MTDPNIIIYILMGLYAAFTVAMMHWEAYKSSKSNVKAQIEPTETQKALKEDGWDDEWLKAEAKRHSIVKIEPKKLYFMGDITRPGTEGFQWTCQCSGKGVGINLEMAKRNYEKHVKAEREKALAELGRFE